MPAQRQNVSDREALLSCMEQGSSVVCNRTSVVNLVEKGLQGRYRSNRHQQKPDKKTRPLVQLSERSLTASPECCDGNAVPPTTFCPYLLSTQQSEFLQRGCWAEHGSQALSWLREFRTLDCPAPSHTMGEGQLPRREVRVLSPQERVLNPGLNLLKPAHDTSDFRLRKPFSG